MQISELLEKQRELDNFIIEEKCLTALYNEKFLKYRKLALNVEVGELANATRCFKYWSNKPSEPKERLLDELADCIHFTLSLINLTRLEIEETTMEEAYEIGVELYKHNSACMEITLTDVMNTTFDLISDEEWGSVFTALLTIGIMLGFTAEEIEQAYLKKHEVNYKRQVEGY